MICTPAAESKKLAYRLVLVGESQPQQEFTESLRGRGKSCDSETGKSATICSFIPIN
jgi:hypothetical protein